MTFGVAFSPFFKNPRIASIVVGYVGVHAIDTGVASFLDVAIVIALTAFLAAIGFARFVERGGVKND